MLLIGEIRPVSMVDEFIAKDGLSYTASAIILERVKKGKMKSKVYLLIGLILTGSIVNAESGTEKLIEKLRSKQINQPLTSELTDKLYGGLWKTWGGSNSGDCGEYATVTDATERAKEIREAGYTGVVISGVHWRLDRLGAEPRIFKNLKLVVDACHNQKMIVICHFDLSQFSARALPFAMQHPEWWMIDLQTRTTMTKFCPSNLEFQQFYSNYLTNLVKQTGVDGLMLDEAYYFADDTGSAGSCACQVCQTKFTQETRLSFPEEPDSDLVTKLPNDWYNVFTQWRINALNEFNYNTALAVKREYPNTVFVSYSSTFLAPGQKNRGVSFIPNFKYFDAIGIEPAQGSAVYTYPELFVGYKLRLAVGELLNKPNWALSQTVRNQENITFLCGFVKMLRHTIWSGLQIDSNLTNWQYWFQPRDYRTLASAGVVYSLPTSDISFENIGDGFLHGREIEGWTNALLKRNIPYDILPNEALTPERVRAYPVIILPHTISLSAQEQQVLSKYIQDGGVILASGLIGYDAKTNSAGIRPAFHANVLGCTIFPKETSVADNVMVKAIYKLDKWNDSPPLIAIGKGFLGYRSVVFAYAERDNFRMWDKKKRETVLSPGYAAGNQKLIDTLLSNAFAQKQPDIQIQAPKGLIVEPLVSRVAIKGQYQAIINFLDGSGRAIGLETNKEYKEFEVYRRKPLSGQVEITLRGKINPQSLKLVSPDWQEPSKETISIETSSKGESVIKFSVKILPIYSQLRFNYE